MARILESRQWATVQRWPVAGALLLFSGVLMTFALSVHRQPTKDVGLFILTWLLALLFLLSATVLLDRAHPHPALALHWNRADTCWIGAATLLALVLRLLDLGQIPLTFHNDEAIMAVRATQLLHQPLADPAFIDNPGYVNLWYYTLALSIQLFGHSIGGIRMIPALLGGLTIATTYLFIRLLFTQRVAVLTSFLLATFHFHIHFSRIDLNNVADPLLGTLILNCLLIGWRTRRYFFFALAGVLLGLALYVYTGARLFFPLTLILGVLWVLPRFRAWRTWATSAQAGFGGLVGIGVLFMATPLVQNILNNPKPFMTRFQRDGLTLDKVQQMAAQQKMSTVTFLYEQVKHAVLAFHYYPDIDIGGFYDRQLPILTGVAGILFVLGLILCLAHWREWRFQLPLAWLALTVLIGGVMMVHPPSVQRYITLAPVICFIIALSVDWLTDLANVGLSPSAVRWQLVTVLLVAYLSAESLHRYFFDYLNRETYGTPQSEMATMLAKNLQTLRPTPTVVYVGKETRFARGSSIPRYVLGDYQSVNPPDLAKLDPKLEKQLFHTPTPPCVATVVRPGQLAALKAFQKKHPNGQFTTVTWPLNGRLIFYVYAVGCRR